MVDDVINSLCISSVVKGKIGSAALFNIVHVWVAIKYGGETYVRAYACLFAEDMIVLLASHT